MPHSRSPSRACSWRLASRASADTSSCQRQEVEAPQQRGEVVDVAVHAARDAGILDLERELAPALLPRAVDLANRGRGDRLEVEVREFLLPALAVFAAEHATQLGVGHRVALRTQHVESAAELLGHEFFALTAKPAARVSSPVHAARRACAPAFPALPGVSSDAARSTGLPVDSCRAVPDGGRQCEFAGQHAEAQRPAQAGGGDGAALAVGVDRHGDGKTW